MKKILWLPGWYPSAADAFKGDFIQRQGIAAAACSTIYILFIEKISVDKNQSLPDNTKTTNGQLTEEIIYYKASSIPVLGKIINMMRYFSMYSFHIRLYIDANGKPDAIHAHIPIKAGMAAMYAGRKYKIPVILTEHYGIYNDVVEDRFSKRSWLFRYYTKKVIQKAARFLPVSEYLGKAINERVVSKPFTVIPNTVTTEYFNYIPPPVNRFRFLHASNMVPLKNVSGIIDAAALLWNKRKDFEIQLVGPVPREILEYAKKSLLYPGGLLFTGEISYKEVSDTMKASHALLLFSDAENMPCVILESLCCGRPVIATKVGGIPEAVNDNNGILVEPGNVEALAAAMEQMIITYNHYSLPAIAQNAATLYGNAVVGKALNEIYQQTASVNKNQN